MNLVSLQFKTTKNFKKNFKKLVYLIKKSPKNSFILAPELCITGYAYNNLDKAVKISKLAIKMLTRLSIDKTISLTLIQEKKKQYINTLYIFNKNQIIHTQSKYKLFSLSNEHKYFKKGDKKDIKIINIDGLKIACLICFELRFINLWEKIQGADLILVPAMWGRLRKDNFDILTKALAIINQCFVIASNSANKDMSKGSGIITPFGEKFKDDNKKLIIKDIDLKEIQKMRRYLNTGIQYAKSY
ncbi:FIG003879: Predicted amidohydrolase [hydrothermal vent metagenome]|uniref:FIG003879: Predicted amidohydrolase n=1 Tax=hydrothermal vent metagenome TaxID=652676 RepID=A0A3B1E5X8_9ZZZZ